MIRSHSSESHTPGQQLLDLLKQARKEVCLVAPFVKAHVFARLIDAIDLAVPVTLITRWEPREIAAGVSDLEVWDIASARKKVRILLVPKLHAKYYRADSTCLVGSANLTGQALGWVAPSNIEILLEEEVTHPLLKGFEEGLQNSARRADESLFEEMKSLIAKMPPLETFPVATNTLNGDLDVPPPQFNLWTPTLRTPEVLFQVYSGETEAVTRTALSAAQSDLSHLCPPPGLPKDAFNATVAATLLQTPLLRDLDPFLEDPRRFGEVTVKLNSMADMADPEFDWDYGWQTLMRWLLHFFPKRYERTVPRYSEVFRRLR